MGSSKGYGYGDVVYASLPSFIAVLAEELSAGALVLLSRSSCGKVLFYIVIASRARTVRGQSC